VLTVITMEFKIDGTDQGGGGGGSEESRANQGGKGGESWATVGQYVELHGLTKAPHLNGKTGMISSGKDAANGGRYSVSMRYPWQDPATGKLKHQMLALKACNIRPMQNFKAGQQHRMRMLPCDGCKYLFDRDTLLKCSQCRYTRYCSQKCQLAHWKDPKNCHKEDCRILRDANHGKQLEDDGSRIYASYQRGCKLMMKGKFVEAEREFRRLIEEEEFYTIGAYSNLGSCVLFQSRHDEALALLLMAVSMPPVMGEQDQFGLYQSYMQLGDIFQNHKHDLEGAAYAYEQALKAKRQDPEALVKLQQCKR